MQTRQFHTTSPFRHRNPERTREPNSTRFLRKAARVAGRPSHDDAKRVAYRETSVHPLSEGHLPNRRDPHAHATTKHRNASIADEGRPTSPPDSQAQHGKLKTRQIEKWMDSAPSPKHNRSSQLAGIRRSEGSPIKRLVLGLRPQQSAPQQLRSTHPDR